MKCIRTFIVVFLLLTSLAVALQSVSFASANFLPFPSYSLQINADGTIRDRTPSPNDETIRRDGNVYTLTRDLDDTAILIRASNIVFDGSNHLLSHKLGGEKGVEVSLATNVTVKNIFVNSLGQGIGFMNSANCTVVNSTVTGGGFGILVDWSQNVVVANNSVINCSAGVGLISANNSEIFFNRVTDSRQGFYVLASTQNIANNNIIKDNNVSVQLHIQYGKETDVSSDNTFYANAFVDNKQDIGYVYESTLTKQEAENFSRNAFHWDKSMFGNFWSNYNGSDTNGDGIGNQPYVINGDNVDYYPVMSQTNLNPSQVKNQEISTVEVSVVAVIAGSILMGIFVYYRRGKQR